MTKEEQIKEFKKKFIGRGEAPTFWPKWNSFGRYPLKIVEWIVIALDTAEQRGREEGYKDGRYDEKHGIEKRAKKVIKKIDKTIKEKGK